MFTTYFNQLNYVNLLTAADLNARLEYQRRAPPVPHNCYFRISNFQLRQPDHMITMASARTLVIALSVSLPVALCQHQHGSQDQYKPSNNSPGDDPGHNEHQETLIFACLGAIIVMGILVVILLWFFVDRTKQTVSQIERLLPELVERFKNDEFVETGPGHLSGTFDAKGEFEAGFKGSADFIDATGDRVKLTSYSKRDDTVTTVVSVDGPQSTGLTAYTRKINNSDMPIDNNTEAATYLPTYAQMDHQVGPVVAIDGPMSAHALPTSSSRGTKTDVSDVSARSNKSGVIGGGIGYVPTSPNHVNGYSPNHISGNSYPHAGHNGQYRRKKRQTPPTSPKDPEKAALHFQNGGPMYSDPPAYDAYDNTAVSIDKRDTLPISSVPSSKEKLVESDNDKNMQKRRNRASFYVESHV